ncbi:hypothetical protein Hanom_Chr07g00648001 [Helianthus anomalus]
MNSKKTSQSLVTSPFACESSCPAATRACGRAHSFTRRSKPFNLPKWASHSLQTRSLVKGFLLWRIPSL